MKMNFKLPLIALAGMILISGLVIAVTTLTTFSDGSPSKEIIFTSAGSDITTAAIKIPKDDTVIFASIDVDGTSIGSIIPSYDTYADQALWTLSSAQFNETYETETPLEGNYLIISSLAIHSGGDWVAYARTPKVENIGKLNYTLKYAFIKARGYQIGPGCTCGGVWCSDCANNFQWRGYSGPRIKLYNSTNSIIHEIHYMMVKGAQAYHDNTLGYTIENSSSYTFIDTSDMTGSLESNICCHSHEVFVEDTSYIIERSLWDDLDSNPNVNIENLADETTDIVFEFYSNNDYLGSSQTIVGDAFDLYNNENTTNPSIDIGNDGDTEWSYTSEFSATSNWNDGSCTAGAVCSSLVSELNSILSTCTPDVNNDCTIPINVSSDSAGKIVLDNLNIVHGKVSASIPVFVDFNLNADEIAINVDDRKTINMLLTNNLDVPDEVNLSINVFWARFRDDSYKITVKIPEKSTIAVPVKIRGLEEGMHLLKISAVSSETGLSSEDSLKVRVLYKKKGFLGQTPGLGWSFFILIVLAGGLIKNKYSFKQ